MISKDDPLKNLYVDKDKIDRLRLFLVLKRYLGIDRETGSAVFFEEYHDLDDEEKIIVYLLYRRAKSALGHIDRDEIGISIRDISKSLDIEYNKMREYLKEIEPVECDKNRGRYYIPGENIETAVKELSHEDEVYYSTEKFTKRIK